MALQTISQEPEVLLHIFCSMLHQLTSTAVGWGTTAVEPVCQGVEMYQQLANEKGTSSSRSSTSLLSSATGNLIVCKCHCQLQILFEVVYGSWTPLQGKKEGEGC